MRSDHEGEPDEEPDARTEDLDPDAPGSSLFTSGDDVEPNEPA
jgi:hypothetical protein